MIELENIGAIGIVGIMLIFVAMFMLVSISSWIITKYTNSKKERDSLKNKISKFELTK
jgi:NhaP-type Na+/H+ or K+/H+ antiporter